MPIFFVSVKNSDAAVAWVLSNENLPTYIRSEQYCAIQYVVTQCMLSLSSSESDEILSSFAKLMATLIISINVYPRALAAKTSNNGVFETERDDEK